MKSCAVVALLFGLFAIHSLGRLTRPWTYEDLLAESDFVGLLEPLANQPAKDVFTIEVSATGGSAGKADKVSYHGIDTRFRIEAILKSDGKATKELTVLHFSQEHAETGFAVVDGPSFIYFTVGPLQYEKRVLKDKKVISEITVLQGEPLWLAFLKRRAGGRYEPVSGREDPDESFFELHKPTHG
jgi:hypothetical protein